MIKLIQANKPKYVDTIALALEATLGSSDLLKQPSIAWFLMADETGVVGIAYLYSLSDVRMHINVLFTPDNVHHKGRKQAGKDLLTYLKKESAHTKLETMIPVQDKQHLRYFAQIGFKREGVARASALINGTLTDQVHMGYVL